MTREEYENVYEVECDYDDNELSCDIISMSQHGRQSRKRVHADKWMLDGDIYSEGTTEGVNAYLHRGVCQLREDTLNEGDVVLDCDV